MQNMSDTIRKTIEENSKLAAPVTMEDKQPEKKIKVYFAVLNSGRLRQEMSSKVIPAMQATPGIELVWEHPGKTWANPISSNRCHIVNRFLETDCDFLLMIDDDVVPLHNPCEMVFADVDVLGSPALVRSEGKLLNWTAYVKQHGVEGYSALDLEAVDDMFDVLEVAIVGTGCIMIKREVLENIQEPFHSVFNPDGTQKYGTDFAFCRRATEAGYRIWTMTHRRCEHFKTVGFAEMDGWDNIDYFETGNAKYQMYWGDYSISQKDWKFLETQTAEIWLSKVQTGDQSKLTILEFGAGLSSLLLSERHKVISYETDPEHAEKIRTKKLEHNDLEVRVWDGINPPENLNPADKFDLVFVDGPKSQNKGGVGRDAAIRIAAVVSDRVIVHDAGRQEEEIIQRKYLRSVFKLIKKSGRHITRCQAWLRRPYPVTLEELKEAVAKPQDRS